MRGQRAVGSDLRSRSRTAVISKEVSKIPLSGSDVE
jgi:hypothetical protein